MKVMAQRSSVMTARHPTPNEEPELSAEESVPLDGKDRKGEEMMEELGRDLKKRKEGEGVDPEDDPGPLPEQFPVS
jgi:hypothetical protein